MTNKTKANSILECVPDIASWLSYDPTLGDLYWSFERSMCPSHAFRIGSVAGHVTNHGYIHVRVRGKLLLAHRVAWTLMTGEDPPLIIDHINRNPADNRWCNLRAATRTENLVNSDKGDRRTTSIFKGVSKRSDTRWIARLSREHLGSYRTEIEAALAYNEAAVELYGKYAALNEVPT